MDRDAVDRVIALFEGRGQLDRLEHVDEASALACLSRAADRLKAASVLADTELWESAFTTAYDAYRTAADAIVLRLGFRVPATQAVTGTRPTSLTRRCSRRPMRSLRRVPSGSARAGTSRRTSTRRDPSTRPPAMHAGRTVSPRRRSPRSVPSCQPAESARSSIGTIGRLTTVSWNEPSPASSAICRMARPPTRVADAYRTGPLNTRPQRSTRRAANRLHGWSPALAVRAAGSRCRSARTAHRSQVHR